jgi:predicted nucleic acid-binding protein
MLSELIAERCGEIRAHLRRRGQPISDFDAVIAATALHYNLTLLTFNRRHFERIPDLRLYEFV